MMDGPQVQKGSFYFYVHDTTGVQSFHIKVGTTDGAADLINQTYTPQNVTLLTDPETQLTFFMVTSQTYISIYPYVEAWLEYINGSSSAIVKQHITE
jgi:hypothetical protein